MRNKSYFHALAVGATFATCDASYAQQWFTTTPGQRENAAMAFDSARARVVLFGGGSSLFAGYGNDTWEWDSRIWNRCAVTGPQPRVQHTMAYDALRGVTVLFGGRPDTGEYFGDTWEWDGMAWTLCTTAGPDPRARHAMAYDSDRKVVVLFGGFSPTNQTLNDTWEWNGTTWALRSVSGPTRRSSHAMAYDATRHVTVMFGGASQSSQFSADLWEWNGTTWTQRQSSGPMGRNSHSMTYDSDRAVVLLFGGMGTDDALLWEWNGTSWASRTSAYGLHQMLYGSMVYDSARKVATWYGGVTQSGGLSSTDVWMFGSPCEPGQWQRQPNSVSARLGSSVLFSAESSAYPAPTYRWRKNGIPVSDGPTGSGSVVSGAMTIALQIANVGASDIGSYDCVATSSCSESVSNSATLSCCPADFDGDGFLTGTDFDLFVQSFENGCL